jgi:hypothetical protein
VPLSEIQRAAVKKRLSEYCDSKVPPHVRDKLRLCFRIDNNAVVLYEERPDFMDATEWIEVPIAKFRYIKSRRVWRLYCQFRDLRWHEYQPLDEADDFDALLGQVDADPTCIFWG